MTPRLGPASSGANRSRGATRLLKRLKPQERRALALQAQGYSYAEIQAITGWTYTKVNPMFGRRGEPGSGQPGALT